MFKKHFFLVLFFLVKTFVFAEHIDINWNTSEENILIGKKVKCPSADHLNLYGLFPQLTYSKQVNSNYSIMLENLIFTKASEDDINYFTQLNLSVHQVFTYQAKVVSEKGRLVEQIKIFPFVIEEGQLKKLISFDVSQKVTTKGNQLIKSKAYNSVFAQGDWYKIKVEQDGVHKISKSDLEAMGINLINIDPRWINIYGTSEGKLPEANSVATIEDPIKHKIKIVGEEDGVFDDEDYILFYAWGPSRWYLDNTTNQFYHDNHIYSDYNYYFIQINPLESAERISTYTETVLNPDYVVTSYSYYDKYEKDLINLMKGGQRWYGESFELNPSQIFTFNVPNIDQSAPAKFSLFVASNGTAGCTHSYVVNNQQYYSSNVPYGSNAAYGRSNIKFQVNNPTNSLDLTINYNSSNPSVNLYLDYILLNTRRNLYFNGSQYRFRDLNSKGNGKKAKFVISNASNTLQIWDLTIRQAPKEITGIIQGTDFEFYSSTDTLKEFVVFNGTDFKNVQFVSKMENQNLHGLSQADYLIVTPSDFQNEALRLANLHMQEGLVVHVVNLEMIYNEFSSGMQDPTAIKRFAKMFYDRSKINNSLKLSYLLLFGDGTYDPKNRISGNNNFIPTYQAQVSEDEISALVSDDYFGLLDDNEGFDDVDLLDIGVGRLLISSSQIAKEQVDKIEHYMKNGSSIYSTNFQSTYGDWKTKYVLVADDEQNGDFVSVDGEPNYKKIKQEHPELNCDKLYLDAYQQITTPGGQRYPDVNEQITQQVDDGILLINYIGHGGEVGAAEERVITIPQIQAFKNYNHLNLFVSATCEFTKYDDPSRVSAGEWVSLNPKGGAIALMTTTRPVYISINTDIVDKFYAVVFDKDTLTGNAYSFGDIIRITKNKAYASENKRCFTLIGDPALRFALPKYKIVTDSINHHNPFIQKDTLRALDQMFVKGHVEDDKGNKISNFNGVLSPVIFDKVKTYSTLGQDTDSPIIPFEMQKNELFKGQVSVVNGEFSFSFILPKDIDYSIGKGKISYYADNGATSNNSDAIGVDTNFYIGGINSNAIVDNTPPVVKMYLNDESFVSGGLTNSSPLLIAEISDDLGINTVGNGIGHDITAIIDAQSSKPIILNNFYKANLDQSNSGKISYQFTDLTEGKHTLTLKAWDVNNNSGEAELEFVVKNQSSVELNHVYNYPNPFTTQTKFYFEHNQINENLEIQVDIFTLSGKVIKTIQQQVSYSAFRSFDLIWDGKDEYGDKLAKGVYVYRLKVKNSKGEVGEKIEKLVIL